MQPTQQPGQDLPNHPMPPAGLRPPAILQTHDEAGKYQSQPGRQPPEEPVIRPNILIAGPSGSGKSSSLRNLDPERTIILSTEQKELPFRNARKFRMNMNIANLGQFLKAYQRALDSTAADVLIIDSFTSLTEFAYIYFLREVEKSGDKVQTAWLRYRDCLHDVLLRGKSANDKHVVFIGIDTMIQDDQQRLIKSCDVQGGLKGKVEKEFLCVFWTKVLDIDVSNPKAQRHFFCTQSDGTNKAKTPMDMYDDYYIDNDLAAIIAHMDRWYNTNE